MSVALYAVRIPTELAHVFQPHDDLTLSTDIVFDLDKLSKHLALEDIFYLIYEQTADKTFLQFVTDTKVNTILQHPDNINWINTVREQYDAYIRKREDLGKINASEVVFTLPAFTDVYCLSCTKNALQGSLLVFTPIDESTPLEFVEEKNTRPANYIASVYSKIMKLIGYDALRKHPISKYLLTLR